MNYRLLVLPLLVFISHTSFAQIYNPVKWSFSYNQVSGSEFDLVFTAKIDKGWNIYSQYLESDEGPVPTSFNFDEGSHFKTVGKNKESGKRKEGYDKLFDMNLIKLMEEAVFTQRVEVSDKSKPITGYLNYMTCDDEKCLPPTDVEFSFDLSSASMPAEKKEVKPVEKEERAKTGAAEKKEEKAGGAHSPGKAGKAVRSSAAEDVPGEEGGDEEEAMVKQPGSGILNPVTWSAKVMNAGEGEYDVIFHARIEKGWYTYSQFLEDADGPYPTTYYFDEKEGQTLVGKTKEESPKIVKEYDVNFDMELVKLKESATFTQRIKAADPGEMFTGALEFMACDATKCLPPEVLPFKADLQSGKVLVGQEAMDEEAVAVDPNAADDAVFFSSLKVSEPVGECGEQQKKEGASLWRIFVLGFIGGLLALLTPCVFPMIPLTVSFFTKSSGDKKKGLSNAFLYGFFILLVYVLLSTPFHLMDTIDPNILNNISTNVWLNIFFFLIFLFFAFSFFGYYELTLPSSWTNRVSAAEGIGGLLGIFFMALTLALVSFSCTGPILGALLAGALTSDGGAMQLTSGMAGFGLALALPFGLFAAFPSWLNSLPKSGGWLNSVKVVLGFVELALALKFLSNADLVKKFGLLKIEPFLALWIIIAVGIALYLFGKLKFPHDSPVKKLSAGRIVLGLASLAFAVYMATGFIYDNKAGSLRPLKLLSGLAPPACYSWFYPCDCPQNLNCFKDFDEGLAYARKVDKPIIIDFTGHACVNCRKMEEHVWPEPEVYKYLKDDYVLVSLYVDEKLPLPEDQKQTLIRKSGEKFRLRTTGQKWQFLQTEHFNNNSQPWYVLISPHEDENGQLKLLTNAVGYTPDPEEYANFLQCGLENYEKVNNKELLGEK